MPAAPIQCPKCQAWLLEGVFDPAVESRCPACGAPMRVEVFPAYFRETNAGRAGETLMTDGESGCFFHPQKKAEIPCEGCGRFLCALCDCELAGHHYCPACLESGVSRGKIAGLERSRPMYDGVALALAVYPAITPLAIIAAPIAIFIAIRYWNSPGSIIPRGKSRHYAAIAVAAIAFLGWIALFVVAADNAKSNG